MRLLTQDEAKGHIEKMLALTDLPEPTQRQVIEAVELLDDLQYSYYGLSCKAKKPIAVRIIAANFQRTRDQLANDHDVCTTCYQPGHVCFCGREFDGWWDVEELYENEDDITCWPD